MPDYSVDQAKQFLKDRILAEASRKNVTLSRAEIAMLTYSEPAASPEERELADELDSEIDMQKYEAKISKLIRSAHKRDVAEGSGSHWKEALHALRREDLYVMVMVRSAGVGGALPADAMWQFFREELQKPDVLCLCALAAVGLAIFFTPLGSFLRSDVLRGVLYVAWLAGLWAAGEWSRRRMIRK